MTDEIALLSGATKALAQVSTASQAWELARTAEAARRYAQLRGLGTEAVNYATGIKAKALVLVADFVDEGQRTGAIRSRDDGRSKGISDPNTLTLADVLGIQPADDSPEERKKAATKAAQTVHQARTLKTALAGADVDALVKKANDEGDDLGLKGLRMAAAAEAEPEPVPEPIAPIEGKYNCLVIDPPWPMPKIERDVRPDQGKRLDYPTMTLEDIADEQWVPVRTHAAADCHLYLWVTHKFLPAGLDLMAEWGFNYQCAMTWRKNVGITPFSWMYDTEHVLFGRRGNLPLSRMGLRLSFEAKVVGHSVKPDVFYERVIEASPGPRLEMFARTARDGFTPWGNEVAGAS